MTKKKAKEYAEALKEASSMTLMGEYENLIGLEVARKMELYSLEDVEEEPRYSELKLVRFEMLSRLDAGRIIKLEVK